MNPLLELWRDVLATAGSGDRKAFRSVSDAFVNAYKRAGAEQGAFHRQLAAENRQWAVENGFAQRGESPP